VAAVAAERFAAAAPAAVVAGADASRVSIVCAMFTVDAATELAQIDLSRTEIRAPRAGRLSEISARVGQLVSGGTQLMYLVPDDLWVVANFKETQVANMRTGQRVTLKVDALSDGTTQSLLDLAVCQPLERDISLDELCLQDVVKALELVLVIGGQDDGILAFDFDHVPVEIAKLRQLD